MKEVKITDQLIEPLVRAALEEDLGSGDVTVEALVPADRKGEGRILAKSEGVLCGLMPASLVFKILDSEVRISMESSDGRAIRPGQTLMTLRGPVASLLRGERTALNFLQHLSGVATLTARFREAILGTRARILDTRKTLPGLRLLEKAAVKAGGGTNHRIGLYDMVLIKDNHLEIMEGADEPARVRQAVRRSLQKAPPGMKVQVEVTSLEAALEAGKSGAHMVLLDNMTPEQMAEVVRALENDLGDKRPLIEASGGITLSKVKEVAAAGVDRISIGALTHSAPALDIAMYIGFDG
ncbi:MAG: carboxylating nicotinate-nucleotide diphosphorylase [Planctomycetota bacterium]